MSDYTCYRMNSYAEMIKYEQELGRESYVKYIDDILTWLLSRPKGFVFDVERLEEEKRELFIKVTCMLIADGTAKEFSFNETFTILKS